MNTKISIHFFKKKEKKNNFTKSTKSKISERILFLVLGDFWSEKKPSPKWQRLLKKLNSQYLQCILKTPPFILRVCPSTHLNEGQNIRNASFTKTRANSFRPSKSGYSQCVGGYANSLDIRNALSCSCE